MDTINKLIDKATETCSPSNDSALAKRMHVSRSAVSLWRKGGTINEKHLTALIALADVDEITALQVLAEQAETKPQKAVWTALLHRLGTAAAVVLCAIGIAVSSPAKASEIQGVAPHSTAPTFPVNAYYVKSHNPVLLGSTQALVGPSCG